MSTYLSADGSVFVSSNKIAEVTGYNYEDYEASTCDTTSFDSTVEEADTELLGGRGSIKCHYDKTDTTAQGALTGGASVTLNVYPTGNGAGEKYKTGTVIISNVRITGQMGSTVQKEFDFRGVLADATVGS